MSSNRFPPLAPGPSPDPPLHEMSARQFEKFCRDIGRDTEENVKNAGLYEKQGVAQFGADYYVHTDPGGMIVGSCKAHKNPSKTVIIKAAAKFVRHWDEVWKPQGVTRFIICLAAPIETQSRIDHVREARKIVEDACGIEAEVWGRDDLVGKCAHLPHIVQLHMGTEWKLRLCDEFEQFRSDMSASYLNQMIARLEALEQSQRSLIEAAMTKLEELLASGARGKAFEKAHAFQSNPALWEVARPAERAQTLRTKGAALLGDDTERAIALYAEALSIHPPDDRYFDLVVESNRSGPRAALDLLPSARTERERVLRGGLLVEIGRYDAALEELERPCTSEAHEANRRRTRSVAFLGLGRTDEAIAASDAAFALMPHSWAISLTRATSYFARSVSPANGFPGLNWPKLYSPFWERRDKVAVEARQQALLMFEALMAKAETPELRASLGVWQFAAWLDTPSERDKASKYLDENWDTDLFHQGLLLWAFARRLEFDHNRAATALDRLIEDNAKSPEVYSARLLLFSNAEDFERAREFLDRHQDKISQLHAEAPDLWRHQLEAEQPGPPIDESFADLGEDRYQRFKDLLADDSASAVVRFEAAACLSDENAWREIWSARSFLLDEIGTYAAFRMCVYAASEVLPAREAYKFVCDHLERYIDEALPEELSSLILQLRADSGDVGGALTLADASFLDPSQSNYLDRAFYRMRAGDVKGAGHIVRQASQAANPALSHPRAVLGWANSIKSATPALAGQLLREISPEEISPNTMTSAALLANTLIPEEAAPFVEALYDATQSDDYPNITALSFEQAMEYNQAQGASAEKRRQFYERGELHGHALYRDKLGIAYLVPTIKARTYVMGQPLTGHATRAYFAAPPFSELVLDITSILMLEILNLWEELLDSDLVITLPASWSFALLTMLEAANTQKPDGTEALLLLKRAIDAGQISTCVSPPADVYKVGHGNTPTADQDVSIGEFDAFSSPANEHRPSAVFLHPGIALEVVERGQLQALLRFEQIFILKYEASSIGHAVMTHDLMSKAGGKLQALQDRLSRHVTVGRLKLTAIVDDEPLQTNADYVGHALKEALLHPAKEGLGLAIDDRRLSALGEIEGKMVLNVLDVVEGMVSRGALKASRRDECRAQLRAWGFGYYPPHANEVADCLQRKAAGDASAGDRLNALAAAFAHMGAEHKKLRRAEPFGPIAEAHGVSRAYMLAGHVIRILLRDEIEDFDAEAHAFLWVFDHLRLDWGGEEQGGLSAFEAWHSSVIFAFMDEASVHIGDRRKRVRRLFEILWEERLFPAFQSYPGLLQRLFQRIRSTIHNLLNDRSFDDADPQMPEYRKRVVGRFLDLLPQALKNATYEDQVLAETFGVVKTVMVSDRHFERAKFWEGLEELSASKGPVVLHDTAGGEMVLHQAENGGPLIGALEEKVILSLRVPEICLSSAKARKSALTTFLDEAGLPKAEQTYWLRRFAQRRRIEKRDQLVRQFLTETIAGKAMRLAQIGPDEEISLDELKPPQLEACQDWLGFENTAEIDCEVAYVRIADRYGEEEAIYRWCGVPIAMPARTIAWIAALSLDDRIALATGLFERTAGPIAHSNLIACFSKFADTVEISQTRRDDLFEFIGERVNICHSYARISLTVLLAETREENERLMAGIAAWAWSERVLASLVPLGVDVEDLRVFYEQAEDNHPALVQLLRQPDVIGAHAISSDLLAAACVSQWIEHIKAPEQTHIDALAKALTIRSEGQAPKVSIMGKERAQNATGSWLTSDLGWLADMLAFEDGLASDALATPQVLRDRAAVSEPVDFISLCILSPRGFDAAVHDALIESAQSQAPTASEDELFHIFKTLCDLGRLSSDQNDARLSAFASIFARRAALERQGIVEPSLLIYLELATRACLQSDDDQAWAAVETVVRAASRGLEGGDNLQLRQFVSVLRDTCPEEKRAQFGRLHCLLQAVMEL